MHHQRAWRAAQPMRAAYADLRDSAAARGIEFSLSFEDFERFAIASDYLRRKGPFADSLTVDRIDNLQGYVPGNIQALTRAANSRKRNTIDVMRPRVDSSWRKVA
jgi:hypothetical protein